MNTTKWVQIACSFILMLLPAAIHYRNWKHGDRRTKHHRWITIILLVLWIVAGSGLAWAMWKEFSREERRVSYHFRLNEQPLEWATIVAFPNEGIQHLKVAVLNNGNWPADDVSVMAAFPSSVAVVPSKGWYPVGPGSTNTTVFHTSSQFLIAPLDLFGCPPLGVQVTNKAYSGFDLLLSAHAKNSVRQFVGIRIVFKSGIQQAHLEGRVTDASFSWPVPIPNGKNPRDAK